ncbi:MAG: homogentisate 1,2-dioxygenase [Sandaracinaceae bacterium]
MIDRMSVGEIPKKHHTKLLAPDGALRWEHCLTRDGFEGPYTIAYHQHRPHEQEPVESTRGWVVPPRGAPPPPLLKRHYKTDEITHRGGPPIDARVPLLASKDVVCGVSFPDEEDPVYFADGDSDTLIFVHEGGGTLRTVLGDVPFQRHDYLFVPRGIAHRFLVDGPQHWLTLELYGGLHVPRQFRNELGQLRMDAPYSHRDFVRPRFTGPLDEGIRETVVKRRDAFTTFTTRHSPLDVVGWDGTVWPWAFPILAFQPRVSSVHLPPTWHGTFAARGALICSFVPRPVDFHPDAIPCPYPHSSVDVDEILFYVEGNFTSRRGVGPGSISFHPAGIPHGPHPGSYEKSIGTKETSELAVMLDCVEPLTPTQLAATVEDTSYQGSFLA